MYWYEKEEDISTLILRANNSFCPYFINADSVSPYVNVYTKKTVTVKEIDRMGDWDTIVLDDTVPEAIRRWAVSHFYRCFKPVNMWERSNDRGESKTCRPAGW